MKKQETLYNEAMRIREIAKRCDGVDIFAAYKRPCVTNVNAYEDCVKRIPNLTTFDYHGVGSHSSFCFTFYAYFYVSAVRSDGVKVQLDVFRYETPSKLETIIYEYQSDTYYEVSCEDGGYLYVARDNKGHALRAWNVERG